MTPIAREWSPKGLALSCVLAAFALCLRTDNQLLYSFEMGGVAGVFAWSLLLGVLALCAVVLVSAHDGEKRRWSIGVGLATGAGGVAFALLQAPFHGMASAMGSGVLLGFGLTCLLRQWGRYYRSLSFQGALLNTAASFLIASLLWYAVMHAGTQFLFCLGLLILVFVGGLPLLMSEIVRADEVRAGLREDVKERWEPLVTIWQVIRSGWAAVLGLMFNFFTAGLTFWPEVAGLSGGVSLKPVSYAVLVAVVWWVVGRARSAQGGILEVFYRASLPIAAAIMLASPFLEGAIPFVGSVTFSVVSYLGIAVCNVLGLVILFWMAKSTEVGFSKVFAIFCASCAASFAAGMLVFRALEHDAQVVSLCLLAAYLVAMVLSEVVTGASRQRAQQQTEREYLGTLCDSLSERYGLSARESEILPFLARGRGAKHIAEKLCISAETVRTHCKRIYEKMGVHTKEELLDIIESNEDSAFGA